MKIGCARGCGYTVDVSPEAMQEMVELGGEVVVSHEVCPNDPAAPQRTFRIVTKVYEETDDDHNPVLASIGDTVRAGNFTEAVPALGKALQAQWVQIMGMSSTIDENDDEGKAL